MGVSKVSIHFVNVDFEFLRMILLIYPVNWIVRHGNYRRSVFGTSSLWLLFSCKTLICWSVNGYCKWL